MKISFVSTARYPTEKAYGVTIEGSCSAANRLGHVSNIITIGESGLDNAGNQIIGINSRLLKSIGIIARRRKSTLITKIAFLFLSIFLAFRLKKMANNAETQILWARDILLVYVLKLLDYNGVVVLEIHHVPMGLNAKFLQQISKSPLIAITTLTHSHKVALEKNIKSKQIIICPMAVPTNFSMSSAKKFTSDKLVMGYIGKATSSGNDNGLDHLFRLIKKLSETKVKFSFQFVGLEPFAISRFKREIKKLLIPIELVSFVGNIKHSEVSEYLHKIDIGFVPYPETSYNQARFPIKIPEYAAARCAIFATDTRAHREILNESMATFYSPDDLSSLLEEIICFTKNDPKFCRRISVAVEWAKDFTYERRVTAVLMALGSNI